MELSLEEKKAIKYFKALNKLTFEPYLSILLKLINKQQKEIEELRKENFDTVYIQAIENYKDKIREKIKELENGTYDAKIILEKLLEE